MKTTLPTTTPTDVQEKLAWGICTYNQKVIEEALGAGANPFTCHKTELARPLFLTNRIEALLDAEEISPYYLLFYTPQRATLDAETAAQTLLNTC